MAASKDVDVRQLIRTQRQTTKTKKKIDSPLAKYLSNGQLLCVLCNLPLKSELLWDAHVQGKKHKEAFIEVKRKKALAAKSGQSQPSSSSSTSSKPVTTKFAAPAVVTTVKRKLKDSEDASPEVSEKKSKGADEHAATLSRLPSDFFDNKKSNSTPNLVKEQPPVISQTQTKAQTSNQISGLPADFFDKSESETQPQEDPSHDPESKQTSRKSSDSAIPEGFFDDPKLDAKARKVEYKDPAEVEWEKFQKEMSMQNQISEALIEEDDEEARVERAMSELSEQRLYYIRADVLREKHKSAKLEKDKKAQDEHKETDDSSDSDEDFESFLDWRAKKAV